VLPVLVLALGGAGLLAAELLRDDNARPATTSAGTRAQGAARPGAGARSFLADVIPPPAGSLSGSKPASGISRLVRTMPLERKVAQLMIVGFGGNSPTGPIIGQLKRYDWGGLMVAADNYAGRPELSALTTAIKDQVARVHHVQPLLMAVQQGDEFSSLQGLPPGLAPAQTASVVQAARLARSTGRTLKSLGLNAVFAPSLEVGPESEGAMGVRAYSDEPDQVAAYAQTTVEAYRRAGVLPAAGRFPGLGAAQQAPEAGPPNVGLSVDELRARDLVPYRAAVRAGVPAIVIGPGLYATDDFVVPASQSRAVVSTLLRGQLGFRGLAIADDLTEPAITTSTTPPEAAVASIAAGVDMVYVSGDDAVVRETYSALLAAAKSGKLSKTRIDEALTRALVVKSDLGLLRKRKVPKATAAVTPGG
jgi:beta-N-acetylhexosaminidase